MNDLDHCPYCGALVSPAAILPGLTSGRHSEEAHREYRPLRRRQPLSQASCPATTSQRTDASRPTTRWKTMASGSATAIHLPFGDQSAYTPWNVRGARPWKQPRSISRTTSPLTERAAQLSGARSATWSAKNVSGRDRRHARRADQASALVAVDPLSLHEDGERAVDAPRELPDRSTGSQQRAPVDHDLLAAVHRRRHAARVVRSRAVVKTLRPLTARELEPGLKSVAPGEPRAVRAPGDRKEPQPLVLSEARPRVLEVKNAEAPLRIALVVERAVRDAASDARGVKPATRLQPGELEHSARAEVDGPKLAGAGGGEGEETRRGPARQSGHRRLTLICRGGRCLTVLCLLGRRRRCLTLIRRRGSRRSTVSRPFGRPVAKRVRERGRAERDHGGHDREIPRSPAAKHIHESGDHARFREGTQVDTALVRAGAGRTAGAPLLEDSIRRPPRARRASQSKSPSRQRDGKAVPHSCPKRRCNGLSQSAGRSPLDSLQRVGTSGFARDSSPTVVFVGTACHAGGRGFESRRSRRKFPAYSDVLLPGLT